MDYGTTLSYDRFNTYGYPSYGGNAFAVPNFGSSNAIQGYAQPYADSFVSNTAIQMSPPKQKSFVEKHWGKMLLGAGALVVGGILTKGKLWGKKTPATFEQAQKNLSEIFRKDIPKEEAEAMMKRYQEIYKIEDKDTFIEKLFHQVKKDYGYENSTVALTKYNSSFRPGINGYQKPGEIGILRTRSKKQIFNTMTHEFHHMRQDEIMYRTSPEKFTQIDKNRKLEELLNDSEFKKLHNEGDEDFKELLNSHIDKQQKILKKNFGHLPPYKEGSAEYAQAEKYFEACRSYFKDSAKGNEGYMNNLIEVEAWDIGAKMQEVANYIGKM